MMEAACKHHLKKCMFMYPIIGLWILTVLDVSPCWCFELCPFSYLYFLLYNQHGIPWKSFLDDPFWWWCDEFTPKMTLNPKFFFLLTLIEVFFISLVEDRVAACQAHLPLSSAFSHCYQCGFPKIDRIVLLIPSIDPIISPMCLKTFIMKLRPHP